MPLHGNPTIITTNGARSGHGVIGYFKSISSAGAFSSEKDKISQINIFFSNATAYCVQKKRKKMEQKHLNKKKTNLSTGNNV